MAHRPHRTSSALPAYGLGAVAVLAPQLLGGATELTALIIHGMAAAACCWAAWGLRRSTETVAVPWAAVGSLIVASWTLVQVLPIPCAWTKWSQPDRFELMRGIAQLTGDEDLYCSVSAAPGATWASFAMATSLAALLLATTAASRARGKGIILRAIALSSLTMACVALVHWAFNADKVFGIYAPQYVKPRLWYAPLMNENHMAGHMALGWPVCLGLALASRALDKKIAWGTAAGTVFVTGLMTLSRGGALALVLGGLLFAALHQATRGGSRRRTTAAVTGIVGVCALVGTYFTYDLLAREFTSPDAPLAKLSIALDIGRLALDHPWVGIGRGALADVSASVLLSSVRAMWAENLPIQWVVEWGAPATCLLLVCLAVSVRNSGVARLSEAELGGFCGLVALGSQNLVDFSLELPGVASTAAIALGAYLARERPTRLSPRLHVRPLLWTASATCIVSLLAAVPWLTTWSRTELRHELEHARTDDRAAMLDTLQRAFAGYPMEPVFVVLGARAAIDGNESNAVRWLNLAMRVAPGWPGPHLMAAQFLERRGALEQAAIELSLAIALEPPPATASACEFLRRHPRADLAWTVADPTPNRRQQSLENLAPCIEMLDEREALARRMLHDFPGSIPSRSVLVSAAQQRNQPEIALAEARALLGANPGNAEAYVQLGRVLVTQGAPTSALSVLDGAPAALRNDVRLLDVELEAAARAQISGRFSTVLDRLLTLHGRGTADRARIHRNASSLLASKDPLRALAHGQSAYDLTGDPADLERVHRLAVQAGATAVALRTASELCQVRYHPGSYCRTGPTLQAPP